MKVQFVSDPKGWEEILMSLQPQMNALADQVANNVRAALPPGPGDVVAEPYDFKPRGRTSDRAAASVAVRRSDARLLQARDGILTKAAGAAGLEVAGLTYTTLDGRTRKATQAQIDNWMRGRRG